MARCRISHVAWKGRNGIQVRNEHVALTVLTGGGHFADFRLLESPHNLLWEAPWPTIEPNTFTDAKHASAYGSGAIGRFLSGYTGHALAVPYFGLPEEGNEDERRALHGEAGIAEWRLQRAEDGDAQACLGLEVHLAASQLRLMREITLSADSTAVRVETRVRNDGPERLFQFVEHATFGEPLLDAEDGRIYVSAERGMTWPLGYEGHALLRDDTQFDWPMAPGTAEEVVDLSEAFQRDETGFLAALRSSAEQKLGYTVVGNARLSLAAGYIFERAKLPWITVWEENRARDYAPWNGRTRARGMEFGTSPFPLGLAQAKKAGSIFDTPVTTTLEAGGEFRTRFDLFASPLAKLGATMKMLGVEEFVP